MTSPNPIEKKCSHEDGKLCCHSKEAIILTLSRTPWRLSIKELSDITHFHRNTLRPTLKKLLEDNKNKIKTTGDTKSGHYYYGGITDFYRRQARAIEELDLPSDQIGKIASDIGYNLVKNTLKEALKNGPQFRHNSLYEAILHIKMAYPFSDFIWSETGRVQSGTVFRANSLDNETEINPHDFNLRIHSCLCNGDKEDHISCSLVIGALKGAIVGTCGVDANVKWNNAGNDPKYGTYCQYQITGEIFVP